MVHIISNLTALLRTLIGVSMQALILAGGKGTRLRPLTMHTPKPIVPIVNRPFLLYQIDLLKKAGITDIILSLSYQPKKIEDVLGDGTDYSMHIVYTVEAQPLGTAGAFKNAESYISESTVVFNGDILTDIDLAKVLDQHHTNKATATIVLTRVPNPTSYGLVETGADGRVQRFLEKPKAEEVTCNTINAGIYVLEPETLKYIPEGENYSFEYGLFPDLLNQGAGFYAYISSDYWLDIGTPQRYLTANFDILRDRLNSYHITERQRGEKFDEAARIDELSLVDPSCTIKPGVEIINSVIGPNCFIEEKARIENCVVWSGTRVGNSAVMFNSIIGKSCFIGRAAEIKSGSVLGDKSVVTDYSQIGNGT